MGQVPWFGETCRETLLEEASLTFSTMSISPCWGQVGVAAVVQRAGQVPQMPPGW